MDSKEIKSVYEQSLRAAAPGLYNQLMAEFERCHIHPYDVQASVIEQESGLHIILRFGEGFTQSQTHDFTWEEIEKQDNVISDFFKETGEACKQILIADYYKMMKP